MQLPELISKLPAIADRLDVFDVITSTVRPRQIPKFRADLPNGAVTTRQASC